MEKRMAGEYTTYETRGESHEKVDKRKRYEQIIEIMLENGDLTAKECAVILQAKGYAMTAERNTCAPRLTEMSQNGIVEPIGKKIDAYTGKRVAVYTLLDRDKYRIGG